MTATASTASGAAGPDTVRAALRDPYVQALAAITVAAAVIRFAVIGIPSYWPDEGYTILDINGSLGHVLDTIRRTESTPPLYFVLAWGWAKPFGTSEEGLRSLSALCGVLTVPVVAATAARLAGRRAGLIAAAMVAANPFLIWFAQEARAYALLVLLAAIGFHLFVKLLDRPQRGTLVWWAVASALVLATHYYGVLIVAAEAGWLLGASRGVPDRRWPSKLVAAVVGVGAVGVALAPLAIAQRNNSFATPFAENDSTLLRTLQVPKQFVVGFDAPAEVLLSAVCLALALAGVALLVTRSPSSQRRRLWPAAFVGLVVVVVPIGLAALGFGFVSARYEVTALVPLTVCVAAGFGAPGARRLGIALVAALVAIWLVIVVAVARDPLLQTRGDWRGAAEALGPVPPGGRAIVLSPASGRTSFEVYVPDAKPIRTPVVSVQEVDTVSVRTSDSESLGKLAAAPGTPLPALPPQFKEVGRTRHRASMVVRYRAPGPVPLALDSFAGVRLDDTSWVGLVER
jgi:mannosyltransferase